MQCPDPSVDYRWLVEGRMGNSNGTMDLAVIQEITTIQIDIRGYRSNVELAIIRGSFARKDLRREHLSVAIQRFPSGRRDSRSTLSHCRAYW